MPGERSVFTGLKESIVASGAAYLVLLDPDRLAPDENAKLAELSADAGADALLVGGSLSLAGTCGETITAIRRAASLPVILFPGNAGFVAQEADAILFLSLVSGRNAQFLIGEHVIAAPRIREAGLEVIPTAYLLVDGGRTTSVEFMSATRPLPRDKVDIAMAHALAAQYLGMSRAFFDAGSGAERPVTREMISSVAAYVDIPVMVGGGISDPDTARGLVEAGAKLLVTGDIIERTGDAGLLRAFASAVHGS